MLTHEEVFWREKGFDSKKDSPPDDTDRAGGYYHNLYRSSYRYCTRTHDYL